MLNRRLAEEIYCRAVSEVRQTTCPTAHQRFQRSRGGQDRVGGGVELECIYELNVRREHFREVIAVFERIIPRDDLDDRFAI